MSEKSESKQQLWSRKLAIVVLLWMLLGIIITANKNPQPEIESQELVISKPALTQAVSTEAVVTTISEEVKPEPEPKKVKIDYNIEDIPSSWRSKIKGTDQWDSLIIEISREKGIDPVFLKCIMAIESGGYQQSLNTKNKNGTHDYGLMQVNTSWGDRFDYKAMLSNPKYAISCGAEVILCKVARAKQLGLKPTAHNVFWLYNGYSAQGKKYAKKVSTLFDAFPNKDAYSNNIITN